jgi:high-affinity iron transporter
MGVFLLLIVGGLVLGAGKQFDIALQTLQPELCLNPVDPASACILGPLLWDGHLILPERQFPGILLKTFLGYRDRLFVGQVMAYISFLSLAGTLYWRSLTSATASGQIPTAVSPQTALSKENP